MGEVEALLEHVIAAAREATCDTQNIPACVTLGQALRAWDKARGAICPTCDGVGTIDGKGDYPGEGPPCTKCGGTGLVTPTVGAREVTPPKVDEMAGQDDCG